MLQRAQALVESHLLLLEARTSTPLFNSDLQHRASNVK